MSISKQYELARKITQTNTSDSQIKWELDSISYINKENASREIDEYLIAHNISLNIGFDIMKQDFLSVANKYNISSATLFCIYRESQKNIVDDLVEDAYSRSQATYNGTETSVKHDDLAEEKEL